VISLIHKFLKAGVMVEGMFEDSPEGVPQGGPLSPLLGNIMLNECDHELEKRGHRFVRYADDMMILLQEQEGGTAHARKHPPVHRREVISKGK
jgi:RNA-directed DNA polymerase